MSDAEVLEEVYAASYQRLVIQLFAVCGDMADAEDAVQEAFLTALRKHPDFARTINPEAWVRTVALRRVSHGWRHAAVVRRHRRATRPAEPSVEMGPEHVALVTALAGLDVRQRTVVVLHHLADQSTADIASALDIPEGTVKSRLARGRARLAELLTEKETTGHVPSGPLA